jgi:hypothetical protein
MSNTNRNPEGTTARNLRAQQLSAPSPAEQKTRTWKVPGSMLMLLRANASVSRVWLLLLNSLLPAWAHSA